MDLKKFAESLSTPERADLSQILYAMRPMRRLSSPSESEKILWEHGFKAKAVSYMHSRTGLGLTACKDSLEISTDTLF